MANNFVHCELSTGDLTSAHKFYKKLFDWEIGKMPGSEYLGINTGSKTTGGGMQAKQMPEQPTAWTPYVEVADVKKALAKAAKLGATIVMPFTDIGMGSIGMFIDPTGAALGVWTPAPKAKPTKKKPAKKK